MSERDILLLLEDMLESSLKINRYTTGMSYNDFIVDDKTVDAVVRNFEIIGEAANRIDPDFRSTNPEIEWKGFGDSGTGSFMIILELIMGLCGISSRIICPN